jgi:hypothetical protein
MYAVVIVHLLVGLLLPWIDRLTIVETYHRDIEAAFWSNGAPAAARAQQVWWIDLFGPTIQGVALWMGALVHLGDKYRSVFAWTALIIGVVIWAPQDMWISLRADEWIHVWIDCLSLVVIVPPLLWLRKNDKKQSI